VLTQTWVNGGICGLNFIAVSSGLAMNWLDASYRAEFKLKEKQEDCSIAVLCFFAHQ
jgi:hypothetical protein